MSPGAPAEILVVAALALDEQGRVLLVRKRGTRAFMQPGGKPEHSESQLAALERELKEELGCSFERESAVFLGIFTAPAANEEDFVVKAALYKISLIGSIKAGGEIEEVRWLNPDQVDAIELAPLTKEEVLPLARVGWRAESQREGNVVEIILKTFEKPDEVRHFEKGRFEIVRIGGMTIGRATYSPGWKWSLHIGSLLGGKTSCDVEHVGLVVSGRAVAAMDDGRVIEMRAGDIFHIPPGHDSWVVGDDAYVSLHFLGASVYAA